MPQQRLLLLIALLIMLGVGVRTTVVAEAPAELTPIFTLDQIHPGMTGYGLSVFRGTTIEPFPVEVVSVMRDFGPRRGVVWIRCTSDRMQKLGPVQGMSGSPIYLWADDEPHEQGQGGRLIGAFAFGYGTSKDCFVGVQPIELMREAGGRATQDPGADPQAAAPSSGLSSLAIDSLLAAAGRQTRFQQNLWRPAAFARLLGESKAAPATAIRTDDLARDTPGGFTANPLPLALPLTLPWADVATSLRPILEPLGVVPIAVPGQNAVARSPALVGRPPRHVDMDSVELAPGSVLGIPLASGDLDLSAVGTVTEVLPDGRVLGFGHAMFGQGRVVLPMATGYVHLVMPSIISSFKLGGSGRISGAIVQDENSAVVGRPGVSFETTPVKVHVEMPGQKPVDYAYQIVRHPQMTPVIASIVAVQSVGAVTDLPLMSTLRLRVAAGFTGGLSLKLDSLLIDATRMDVLIQILTLLATVQSNPHEPIDLERIELSVQIEPVRRSATISHAQLRQSQLEPGQMADIDVHLRPYDAPPFRRRIRLKIPDHLRDGDYQLIVCDAATYLHLLFDSHPHLLRTANTHDLIALLDRVTSVKDDALYTILQLSDPSLAIGRQELPQLPSSRRALIESASSTLTSIYQQWVQKQVPVDLVPKGSASFTLKIKADRSQ